MLRIFTILSILHCFHSHTYYVVSPEHHQHHPDTFPFVVDSSCHNRASKQLDTEKTTFNQNITVVNATVTNITSGNDNDALVSDPQPAQYITAYRFTNNFYHAPQDVGTLDIRFYILPNELSLLTTTSCELKSTHDNQVEESTFVHSPGSEIRHCSLRYYQKLSGRINVTIKSFYKIDPIMLIVVKDPQWSKILFANQALPIDCDQLNRNPSPGKTTGGKGSKIADNRGLSVLPEGASGILSDGSRYGGRMSVKHEFLATDYPSQAYVDIRFCIPSLLSQEELKGCILFWMNKIPGIRIDSEHSTLQA